VTVKPAPSLTLKVDGDATTAVVVPVVVTTCDRVFELPAKLPSPEYAAEMVYVPVDGSVPVHAALVTVATVLTAIDEHRIPVCGPLKVKATVPVGVDVPPVELMVAVKVTAWFTVEEAGRDDASATVVAAVPTDWTSAVAPEALLEKFASPLV